MMLLVHLFVKILFKKRAGSSITHAISNAIQIFFLKGVIRKYRTTPRCLKRIQFERFFYKTEKSISGIAELPQAFNLIKKTVLVLVSDSQTIRSTFLVDSISMSDNISLPFYPSVLDFNFRQKLMKKKEYVNIAKEISEERTVASKNEFHYRNFFTTFISPSTPYSKILLVHGVGTGKSACAIFIAKANINAYRKAYVLNKGSSPVQNFKREILKHFEEGEDFFIHDTYTKFSRYLRSISKDKRIEEFSGCIFILDEIHNIVTLDHLKDDKTYSTLLSFFDEIKNYILVGLTATPMRDQASEIVPLLNLFNQPSMRISKEDKNYLEKIDALIRPCVSYYQTTFTYDTISHGIKLEGLTQETVCLKMKGMQLKSYHNICSSDTTVSSTFTFRNHSYASLCSFEPSGLLTSKFLQQSVIEIENIKCLTYDIDPKITYDVKNNISAYSCKFAFMLDIIENTQKYYHKNLTEGEIKKYGVSVVQSRGLVYVFCENVIESGISTFIALFRLFGYEYYVGNNSSTLVTNPKRFTVYAGSSDICPNPEARLELFTDFKNREGDYCKIIIASNVMKESISLKNIKYVFICTPHWNFSSIEQAEGRALRRDTFDMDTYQNEVPCVNIFRLAAVTDLMLVRDLNHKQLISTSIDLYKIKRSADKFISINTVMKKLEDNAIDKYIVMHPEILINDASHIFDIDYSTFILHNSRILDETLGFLASYLMYDCYHLNDLVDLLASEAKFGFNRELAVSCIFEIVMSEKCWTDYLGVGYLLKERNDIFFLEKVTGMGIDATFRYRFNNLNFLIPNVDLEESSFDLTLLKTKSKIEIANFVSFNLSKKNSILNSVLLCISYYSETRGVRIDSELDAELKILVELFSYNIFCFGISRTGPKILYHTLNAKEQKSTSYSTTARKVQVSDKILMKKDGRMGLVQDDLVDAVVYRINYIRKVKDLLLICKYKVYGSISLSDRGRRIHLNEGLEISEKRLAMISEKIEDGLEELSDEDKKFLETESNKSKRRGRLIETLTKETKHLCIGLIDPSLTDSSLPFKNSDLDKILWDLVLTEDKFIFI